MRACVGPRADEFRAPFICYNFQLLLRQIRTTFFFIYNVWTTTPGLWPPCLTLLLAPVVCSRTEVFLFYLECSLKKINLYVFFYNEKCNWWTMCVVRGIGINIPNISNGQNSDVLRKKKKPFLIIVLTTNCSHSLWVHVSVIIYSLYCFELCKWCTREQVKNSKIN